MDIKEDCAGSLCIVTTIPHSINFFQGQIEALNRSGVKTTAVSGEDPEMPAFLPNETEFIPIDLDRGISPLKDLKALLQLYRIFRKHKFDVVQYSTPKASLLGAIAAFAACVPVRLYVLWGIYYMGLSGVKRRIFKMFEKIICSISTDIAPIAHEMIDFVEMDGLAGRSKSEVILNGSACGVDLERFDPEKWRDWRNEIRNNLSIPEYATVIGTVARLTGDKGINELVDAFNILCDETPLLYLLLIGDQEEKDRLLPSTEQIIANNTRIKSVGFQKNPLPYYIAMDIFCLPTYREGFGEVNLEAQAMRLPVVSTNVIGPRESVENGETGFLVEPRSTRALLEPLKKLVLDAELRKQMGRKGRKRVERMFDRRDMIEAVVEHRLRLLFKLRSSRKQVTT